MSIYLQPADYALYGITSASDDQVVQAGALIDTHLKRPEGMLFGTDANGNPAYMLGLSATTTLTATADFAAGNGVVVPVSGTLNMLQVGDGVTIDRTDPTKVETVLITSIDTANSTVTLGGVVGGLPLQFAHSAGAKLEVGLCITEQKYVPKGRSTVMLASTPVARVVGGTGRYAYGRHGDMPGANMDQFNLLAALSKFGGPPAWELWPADNSMGIDARTGELWVPAGVMLAYYSDVRVRYIAGYTYETLPDVFKVACAQVAEALNNDYASADYKTFQLANVQFERFAATVISDDVKAMLAPWRGRIYA